MTFIIHLLAVALGGALGSVGRYLIATGSMKFSSHFPIGTFIANLLGCLLIGFLWGIFEKVEISHEFRLFLFTGFLGGFTTLSTYARESYSFLEMGDYFHGTMYIILSNVLALLMVGAGFFISHKFLLRYLP